MECDPFDSCAESKMTLSFPGSVLSFSEIMNNVRVCESRVHLGFGLKRLRLDKVLK